MTTSTEPHRPAGAAPHDGAAGRASPRLARAAAAAGLVLGLATAASLVAARWSGATLEGGWIRRAWWATDLLAHFRLHYAVGFLALVVLLLTLRRRVPAVLCLVGALIAAAPALPLYAGAPDAAEHEALTLAFLNVRVREADTAALIEHLRETDADLVYLFTTTDELLAALTAADLPYDMPLARPIDDGVQLEPILLSRVPLIDTRLHRWGDHHRLTAVEAIVDVGGTTVRVLGTHALSPQQPSDGRLRDENLAHVADWAGRQTDPVVVLGDLNTTQWSRAFRDLERRGELVDSRRGYGRQASWPTVLGPLGLPIDHALHSPDLVTLDRELGPGFGSQHRSVQLTIAPAG